jgi:hypothetical protein
MKRDSNPIDDFFRESLQDIKMTPSPQSRSKFLEESVKIKGGGSKGLLRWNNILILAGLISMTAVVYLFIRQHHVSNAIIVEPQNNYVEKTNTPINTTPQAEVVNPVTNKLSQPGNEQVRSVKLQDKPAPGNIQKTTASISLPGKSPEAVTKTVDVKSIGQQKKDKENHTNGYSPAGLTNDKQVLPNQSIIDNPLDSNPVKQEQAIEKPSEQKSSGPTGNQVIPITRDNSTVNIEDEKSEPKTPGSTDFPGSLKNKNLKNPSSPKQKWQFTPSLGYSLDLGLDGRQPAHSIFVDGKAQKGRFFLLTGVGYTVNKGFHKHNVDYNDYLGEYKKLDSITFNWDQDHYHLVPSYYMSETDVFDSILKQDHYSIESRYSHIRIPVLLGYQFLQIKNLSFALKTGIEMNFFLDSKKISGEYEAGTKKVISVNPLQDEMQRNNLYGQFNIQASYYISRRLVLELEPQLQYLINPAKGQSLKPKELITPLLRTSLKINF